MRTVRAWWVLAVIALLAFAGAIRLLVLRLGGDADAGGTLLSALGTAVLFGLLAVLAGRSDRRARAADRSGPVLPAADGGSDPGRGRWDLDQVAAQLAREVQDLHGVVFREGRSRRMRLMLDPASAISRDAPRRGTGIASTSGSDTLVGQWWEVTWRRGKVPRLRHRRSTVGARRWRERTVPLWDVPNLDRDPEARHASLRALDEAMTEEARLDISGESLAALLDALAVRSGWVSEGQARTDRAAHPAPAVQVRVDRRVRTAPLTAESVPDQQADEDFSGPVFGAAAPGVVGVPDGSALPPLSTPPAPRRHDVSEEEAFQRLRTGYGDAVRAETRTVDTRPLPTPERLASTRRMLRGFLALGVVILLLCLLSTGIGLIAGMVWWASFIIVGAGLLFCALFVLPFVLIARAELRRANEA